MPTSWGELLACATMVAHEARQAVLNLGLPSFSVVGLAGLGQAAQRRTLHR